MRNKWWLVVAVLWGINLGMGISAYAQGAPAAPGVPGWMAMIVPLIPAIWQTVGPLATAWLTGIANQYKVYVPRQLQVVLVAIFGALGAGLASGLDPVTTSMTAISGGVSQFYAGADAKSLRTEPS